MPLANYQYTSDAGATYQVSLPSDFAAALGLTIATGSEPYLDVTISPRFAAYLSTTGISRKAVLDTRAHLNSAASPLTVDGLTYNLTSRTGESIPPTLNPILQGIVGIPGA